MDYYMNVPWQSVLLFTVLPEGNNVTNHKQSVIHPTPDVRQEQRGPPKGQSKKYYHSTKFKMQLYM
jgi:hypothetical protein